MKVLKCLALPMLGFAMATLVTNPAGAVLVNLTAGDPGGTSSYNSAGNWSNSAAPSSGNDYNNAGFLLRTPADPSSHTFAGDSLTITGSGLASGQNNEALMWKGSGTSSVITVNNLTINGGQLRHGSGDGDSVTWAGNIAVGASGANFHAQGGFTVSAAVSGSSTIKVLDFGNTDTRRVITFTNGANTFDGDIQLAGSAANKTRIVLADDANFNFTIGASGVNNSIFGTGTATFNGDFTFDLSGAANNGSWTIVDHTSLDEMYGSTFTVTGFTDLGSGLWNSGGYTFDTNTGILTAVPEPSAFLFGGLVCSVLGVNYVRKRRSGSADTQE